MKTIDLAGVYFAYDRPDNIIKTLPILLNSNLKTIYIFVDGPKNKKNIIKVNKTKKNIINLTKGNKKIYRIFYKKNLGVKKNFFKSLDFVFKKEKQAIILEDDCLIKENFIDFCFHLLKKYKKNKKSGPYQAVILLRKKHLQKT
ncbi:hypothetical protein IDG52_00790 [Pelagibacterales bacterium SAG-MED23]|nr:hypothetical protein [Pelagibacterales bacterium SAG-MED23]